jgi:hypothetical protein
MTDEKNEPQKIKIRPVEYSLFCDYASMAVGGKLNLMGVFDRIFTKEYPVTHPQMFVVTKFFLPEGDHKVTLTLMQKDKVLQKANIEKKVEQKLISHTHFWGIRDLQIEDEGPLEMHVLIGGKKVFARPLPVIKVDEKAKA